jgi:hypothetical protein
VPRVSKKQQLINRGVCPRLYAAWDNMKARCKRHPDYAGRGIDMDPRWKDFWVFEMEMGPHPGSGFSIDREKNNEGYRRSNCRWTTPKVQANNRRDAVNKIPDPVRAAILADTGTCRGLGKKYGVSYAIISRIKIQGAIL